MSSHHVSDSRIGVQSISKHFGPVRAVEKVSLNIGPGEVHGLIGENGSGKSTLVAMMAGIHKPTSGEVVLDGESFSPNGTSEAAANGVAIITQDSTLIERLSVGANLFLGRENNVSYFGLYRFKHLHKIANDHLYKVLDKDFIDSRKAVADLTFEERKNIEVARALLFDPKVVVFDETTNALSQRSRERLYSLIRDLSSKGVSIVFIAHELSEVQTVCDRISVLKDGNLVETLGSSEASIDELKRKMVGREINADYYSFGLRQAPTETVLLEVDDITCTPHFENVSFQVREGEILGIGGLSDSGMSEIGPTLFGLNKPDGGAIRVSGIDVTSRLKHTSYAVAQGIAYVPKDRDTKGVMLSSSITSNLILPSLEVVAGPNKLLTKKKIEKVVQQTAKEFEVKSRNLDQFCIELSGGNRQKIALSKWFTRDSRIIVLDCPTRGVDVGVKAFIYEKIRMLASNGAAVVMITEELPELIGMSDRIIILKEGHMVQEFQRDENPSEEEIIMAMVQ